MGLWIHNNGYAIQCDADCVFVVVFDVVLTAYT